MTQLKGISNTRMLNIKINTITLHHMVLTLHATYICKQESMMKNAHLANSRCDLAPPPFFSTRGPRVHPRGHVLLPCVGGMQYEEWRMRGIPMCSVSPPGPADDTRRYDGYIVNKIDIRLLCLVNSNLTWFWQWVEFRAYWVKIL